MNPLCPPIPANAERLRRHPVPFGFAISRAGLCQSWAYRSAHFFRALIHPVGIFALGLLFSVTFPGGSARAAGDNGGLGLLPIQDVFPTKLLFLNYAPEPVLALPAHKLDISYQFSVANTIVNSQYAPQNGTPTISQAQVNAGLTAANFPATGFGAYMDMETNRHLFRVRYGLGGGWEVGLDQAWVSFGAGTLDGSIESVETVFGGKNPERFSVAKNQFHYYVYHNGQALIATSTPVGSTAQDPVLSLKWNVGEGGEILPAVSLRVAYKAALDSASSSARKLVSSGHDDFGYALLVSKTIGRFVAHIQVGESQLGGSGGVYVSSLHHQIAGLEYRINDRHSLIAQTSSQTSAFNVGNAVPTSTDFPISRPAEVSSFGYKFAGKTFHFDLGFSEDYISHDNTTDIVIFFDLGWKW
jgi:hypothetical protein